MSLVSGCVSASKWDDVMSHIARWLVRYLGDPRLIIWIAERGGQYDRWMFLIESELNRLAALMRERKTSELDEILLHSPWLFLVHLCLLYGGFCLVVV